MEFDIKSFLYKLGYANLVDDNNGNWRMQALYRNGKNKMSLSVCKKTGIFYDFGNCSCGTLKELARLTLKQDDVDDLLSRVNFDKLKKNKKDQK